MNNISGVYHKNQELPALAEKLVRMTPDSAASVESFQIALSDLKACNIVHSFMEPEEQPFISEDRRYYALAEGELYETPTGEKSLKYLLEHFVRRGEEGWERINGQFVLVVYDAFERRLYIINDRFGLRQFYCHHHEGRLTFSSQIKNLLRLLPETADLSPIGVAELILIGHHIGQSTLFQGIFALPPAAILSFDGVHLQIKRYWKAIYRPDPKVKAGELGDLLQQAVKRQIPGGGRKGVLLSGGMDSRTVAYEARKQEKELVAFTFGRPNSMDVVYAGEVSRRLGIEHHVMEFDPWKWKGAIAKAVWETEGEANFHHYRSILFHPFMKLHCDTLLTGIPGDLFMGSLIANSGQFSEMPLDALMDFTFKRYIELSPERFEKLFHRDCQGNLMNTIRATLESTLAANENRIAADILTTWNLEYRQNQFTLIGASSDRCLFNVRCPFFDHDLLDYTLKIPVHMRHKQSLYIKALWQRMPELRSVPWQRTGSPPFPGRYEEITWKLLNPLRLMRRGPGCKKTFVNLGELFGSAFTVDEMKALLCGPDQRWHRYFDMQEVESVIEDHFTCREDHSTLIAKLLTLHFAEALFLNRLSADPVPGR